MLRIEDIDIARCRPHFEAAIKEDLAWLGVAWDGPVRRQSEHTALYRAALDQLAARGLVYPCDRTRREVLEGVGRAPQDGDAPDERTQISSGQTAWRLSADAADRALKGLQNLSFVEEGRGPSGEHGVIAVDPTLVGDAVLGRKDIGVSYHLAAVIDDAIQQVTNVVRGNDLFAATHLQRVIQALLGLPTSTYRHHALIVRPDGKQFAKRDTTETLRDLRARGVSATELRLALGF